MANVYTLRDATRCAAISAIVGTILVAINEGPIAYLRVWTSPHLALMVGLNYLVPFTVATVSAVLSARARP